MLECAKGAFFFSPVESTKGLFQPINCKSRALYVAAEPFPKHEFVDLFSTSQVAIDLIHDRIVWGWTKKSGN